MNVLEYHKNKIKEVHFSTFYTEPCQKITSYSHLSTCFNYHLSPPNVGYQASHDLDSSNFYRCIVFVGRIQLCFNLNLHRQIETLLAS